MASDASISAWLEGQSGQMLRLVLAARESLRLSPQRPMPEARSLQGHCPQASAPFGQVIEARHRFGRQRPKA